LTGAARVAAFTRTVTVPGFARSGDGSTAASTITAIAQNTIIPDRILLARISLINTFWNMAPSLNLHLYYTIFPFFVKDISPTKKRAVDRPASEQHAEYVFGSPAVLLADS
jgi:hypothetical protein